MEDNVDNMQTNWPICMKQIFRFNEEAEEKAIENTAKVIGFVCVFWQLCNSVYTWS